MANLSRFNATRFGIVAKVLCNAKFMGDEENDFQQIRRGLAECFKPCDAYEKILVDELAFQYLRVLRLYKAEWPIAPKLFERVSEALDEGPVTVETKWISREHEVLVTQKGPSVDLLIRYEASIQRNIGRTLDHLLKYRSGSNCTRSLGA